MATYYFRNTGTFWNLTASWSSTPSPTYTNVAAVPGIADDAIFEAASANCTISTVAASADRLDFTNGGTSNYTGLFTVGTTTAGTLTLSRSLALSPSMSDVTGSAAITVNSSLCSITSNGKSIHRLSLIRNTPLTVNLQDALTVSTAIITNYTSGGTTITFNTGSIFVRGTGSFQNITAGTSDIYINPQAGTTVFFQTRPSIFGTMANNLIISGAGDVNFVDGLYRAGGKITYVTASNIIFSNNHTLTLAPGTTTFDTAGMTWDNCTAGGGSQTMILSSSLNISRSFSYSNNSITTVSVGGSRINAYGNVSVSTAGGINLNNVQLTITGSASGRTLTSFNNMVTSASLEFKLTGGSITVAPSAISIGGGAGTQVEIINNSTGGTIIASGSTITLNASATPRFNTNPILWGNLTSTSTNTVTLLSPFLISSSLTFGAGGNLTFTGSAGWTCANLVCSNTSRTLTLANSSTGAVYRTTTSASLTATSALPIIMTSDNATTRSLWTLDYGAQQSLVYVNGTRIDSSLGQTIWTFGGVRTDTINWATGSRPGTSAYTFVN